MSNDPYAPVLYLIGLGAIALLVDAAIRDKPGRWGRGNASAADVARIVSGGKPSPQPRETVKFMLLLVAAFMLFVVLGGSL